MLTYSFRSDNADVMGPIQAEADAQDYVLQVVERQANPTTHFPGFELRFNGTLRELLSVFRKVKVPGMFLALETLRDVSLQDNGLGWR